MSYILDALKKSEQERGHGHIPSVQTVHTSSLNYSNKQTYWPYIVAAIVLLNLAAIFYFYLNNNATHVANTNADTTSNRNNATPPISAQRPVMEPATNTTPTRMNALPVQQSAHVATSPANNRSTKPTSNAIVFDSNSAQNHNAALSRQEIRSSDNINQEIIEYYDLPESTRRRLPSISVSAHVYSDNPLQRSIVVNNDYLEEGERILDDLILQEITSDGAIMNYRGTVFHYEIVSGWQ